MNSRRMIRSVSKTVGIPAIVTYRRTLASGGRLRHAISFDIPPRPGGLSVIRHLLTFAAGLLVATGLSGAPTLKSEPVHFISLKGYTNVKLDENLHSNNYENNNL